MQGKTNDISLSEWTKMRSDVWGHTSLPSDIPLSSLGQRDICTNTNALFGWEMPEEALGDSQGGLRDLGTSGCTFPASWSSECGVERPEEFETKNSVQFKPCGVDKDDSLETSTVCQSMFNAPATTQKLNEVSKEEEEKVLREISERPPGAANISPVRCLGQPMLDSRKQNGQTSSGIVYSLWRLSSAKLISDLLS